MNRTAATLALLALAGCMHLPSGEPTDGPGLLRGARYVGETWCSDGESGPRTIWLCRIYDRGGRVLVGFYHALTGKLLAVAERIGDGPQVRVVWRAPADAEEVVGRMDL